MVSNGKRVCSCVKTFCLQTLLVTSVSANKRKDVMRNRSQRGCMTDRLNSLSTNTLGYPQKLHKKVTNFQHFILKTKVGEVRKKKPIAML